MLAFFWRRQSFRASITTSSPILFRNLNQSAMNEGEAKAAVLAPLESAIQTEAGLCVVIS
jgi:hypothetical protein